METLDKRVCKETLRATSQRAEVREVIGTDRRFWTDLVTLFRAAIPSLERRSFAVWDPSSVDYESTSSTLIAAHYPAMYRDLERLNDLVAIARNVLTVGEASQDLAAEIAFEQEVFRLINCCVRVTARGYDGETGTGDEEKWQWVVSAYKRLLITSLQFLNNLVARNERRKLMLWVALFDNSTEGILADDEDDRRIADIKMPEPPVSTSDILVALGEATQAKVDAAADALRAKRLLAPKDQAHAASRPVSGYVLFVKYHTGQVRDELGPQATPAEVAKELSTRWSRIPEQDRKIWNARYDDLMEQYEKDLVYYHEVRRSQDAERATSDSARIDHVASRIAQIEEQLSDRFRAESTKIAPLGLPVYSEDGVQFPQEAKAPKTSAEDDYKMLFTAAAGSKILESGKSELMKRLESYPPTSRDHDQVESPTSPEDFSEPSVPMDDGRTVVDEEEYDQPLHEEGGELEDDEEEEDEEEEEEEEDEDDYHESTEDGRGLLTDVPLILGPSEIEVLPMIVMSGIVPPPQLDLNSQEANAIINMHTVRCHLLLAQDNGKNLLRELLIFVAAWDLREEELYFKFMVRIMEAILINGLMPYAYHAFRDKSRSKDIISPAQAVIMKLLTNIFRARAEAAKTSPYPEARQSYPARVDVHIVNFIFTEFRRHIIPQTCALIFLQGKIHQNLASPEDFPLNLWDMERMYEGVYQYLEFFAVLTEEQAWKDVMAEWEVASELVTMLKELESAIPKLTPGVPAPVPSPRRNGHHDQQHVVPKPPPIPQLPLPKVDHLAEPVASVSVERPFETNPEQAQAGYPQVPSAIPAEVQPVQPAQIFEPETPLAYPEDPQDEPSDFEWRNLKKLTVLVLSSLIWKNKKVQDQVREYHGLEALVGCCRHDEHNPYIREHAIMCLRFAVEGNPANAEMIKEMAGRTQVAGGPPPDLAGTNVTLDPAEAPNLGEVPHEVLDTQGYETFMDGKGQVGLRRKEMPPPPHPSYASSSAPVVAGPGSSALQHAAAQAIQGAIAGATGMNLGKGSKSAITTKMAAERAAEIMQTALRDLPLPAGLDRENKDIIARLNRTAMEVTEQISGEASGSPKHKK
ncbi:hypothetical protein MBLNU457_4504t1 [Dothideomycetes sp. NU457]